MANRDDMMLLAELAEQAADYFRDQSKIIAWPGLKPGQRVAALCINAMMNETMAPVRVHQLAAFVGIAEDRAKAIFDGLEHPPYAVTTFDGMPGEFFSASQTLAYGEDDEPHGDEQ